MYLYLIKTYDVYKFFATIINIYICIQSEHIVFAMKYNSDSAHVKEIEIVPHEDIVHKKNSFEFVV